ncbi:MAG: DUF3367 domain-containing protein, partial [Acidimicrobiia bacterium]|nr:DUF3367 domain-containing protein [Acidimicrobiia bacterium]
MAAFWATRHRSLWPLGLGLTVVAAGAMWRNDPTVWFADNRFEQYDDPSGRLASMFTLWDSGRGLGTIRTDLWIGTTVPLAVLRGVGLPIGVTQHLWHGALLVLGGVGAASFLRCFRPRIGLAHVITAGVYMLGPYSAGFLSPSNLYVNYAVAPWIFVIFHRGIHDERRWRWPAVLALVLLALGTADLPGEFFVLVYLVPIALYAVHVDRTTTWVRVGSWVTRSLLLGLLTMAGPLYALFEGREFFAQRLRETELATSLSGNSSWAESWRGLGGWLLYFRDGASFARPQTLVFLTGAVAILVSFIPPLLSVIAVGFLRHRDRLLMGAMVLTGVTMMVALFPADDPSPYGRALEWLFDNVPQAALVRSSYKAGSGAMWGMAALSGISIAAGWHHVRAWEQAQPAGDRLPRASVGAIVALGLLAFAVLAQPFWRTGLYDDERLDDTPAYVDEAMEHLDELPGDGRLLFVPGTNRSQFRWGHVNDDILDASLSRPQLVDVPVHRSAPIPADILDAVDDSLVNGRYENGMITRYAARLGIDHVVIRNDFTWEDNEQPRPASYRDLRADPGLELVATFGRLGENTTSPLDAGLRAEGERLLAPIEVFRVRDPGTVVHLQSATAPLLVAGDGAALPAIARRELAATDTSLRFTGEMDGEALTVALEAGSPLLVTDTNRRTLETIATQSRESFTLSPDAELDRDLTSLFPADGAQTVASYGPASTVGNAGESDPAGANQPWYRPALAVDGDPRTEWRSAALDPVGEGIRVEWSVPAPVGSLTVTPAVIETSRREINELRVTTSAGEERIVAIGEGPAAVALGGEPVDWVEVTAASVRGPGGDIGIVDIELDGDPGALAEWIVLPDDVARAADELPALADALSAAPVGFAFERLDGDGPVPVEA